MGATVILNPAPAQELAKHIFQYIDIITPNVVEAEMLTGIKVSNAESLHIIVNRFFDYGIKNVIITLGSKGYFAGFSNVMEIIPAYKVTPIDTTGAGDVFSGSLAAFLAEGMNIETAARMANASASISVTRLGAQDAAPKRVEIEKFIASYKAAESEVCKLKLNFINNINGAKMKTIKLFFLVLISMTFYSHQLIAQDFQNMTLLGNFGKGEGESKAVFAAGSLVYSGLGNKLQIASFSNPQTPVKIGSVILSDIIEDVVRTSIGGNQHLVLSGGSNMWLINVQNPTTPSLVASVEVAPGTTCEGVATSGTYAYVAAGGGGLKIYNIATPSSPVLVTSIDSLEYCESVVISGQYAYIAAGSRSHILDITNPAAPIYVGRIDGYGGYHQYINVRSGYAYVCNYDASLAVVNVTNPSNPVNVMEIPSGYRTARIIFDGNYGYVAVGDSGIKIYNLVTPSSPVFVTQIQTTGRAASLYYGAITIGGTPTGHIFVANRNPAPGISAINVSNPQVPVTTSFLAAIPSATGSAYIPFYSDGKVYVAYGTAGMRIIDVSNPSNVTLLGTADMAVIQGQW